MIVEIGVLCLPSGSYHLPSHLVLFLVKTTQRIVFIVNGRAAVMSPTTTLLVRVGLFFVSGVLRFIYTFLEEFGI